MTLVSIQTKHLEVLGIACESPLASNLLFAAKNNKGGTHNSALVQRRGGAHSLSRHMWQYLRSGTLWWHSNLELLVVVAQENCRNRQYTRKQNGRSDLRRRTVRHCRGATESEGVGMRGQGKQRAHENYKAGRARE